MESLPKTMKAWIGVHNGEPRRALELRSDQPVPAAPSGSNLLIKVAYAALNPADVMFTRFIPTFLPFRRQPIAGLDFVGHVVQAGPSAPAELSAPETAVCGALSVSLVATGHGSLAEYISVPASLVAPAPKGLDLRAAAGLGITGQTAVISLNEAGVKPGDRVLVNGASGGLGNMLVQLSKAHGAYVAGSCSEQNAALVKQIGADEVSTLPPLLLLTPYARDTSPFDPVIWFGTRVC